MEDGAFIINWINALLVPTPIYNGIEKIALGIFTYITPALLVIAIAVRTLEESLDVTNSNGRWVNAARDMVVAGLFITVYFAAGNLVNDFFTTLYSYFSSFGSIGSVTNQVANMIEALEENTKDTGFINWSVSGIYQTLSLGVYYLSLMLVTSLIAFFHLAQALGYGLAFCWGLIALPMSITRGASLLRGWLLFTAFILVWPIMESLAMGLLMQIFIDVGAATTAGSVGNTRVEQGSLLLAFTTLNIILAVVVVVVPVITNGFVSNSAVGRDFIVPFVAGAAAQVAAVRKATTKIAGTSKAGLGSVRNVVGGAADSFLPKANNGGGGATAPTENTDAKNTSTDPGERQAKQDRRGSIINQQSKTK